MSEQSTDESNPGLNFVVSSFCHSGGCIGVATASAGEVRVRDTKSADGPAFAFSAAAWKDFLEGVSNREFG